MPSYRFAAASALLGIWFLASAAAQDPALAEGRAHLLAGRVAEALVQAEAALPVVASREDAHLLRVEALLAAGHRVKARAAVEEALVSLPNALRLRLLAFRIARATGDAARANGLLAELEMLVTSREWAYRRPPDRLALGEAALLGGADPKKVLERFFDPVKKLLPESPDAWLASGRLALSKSDFELAGKMFGEAVKKFRGHPEAWFGLAQAFAPSDAETMLQAVSKTLELNPRHSAAHLLLAEQHIDAERYLEADRELAEALNPDGALPAAHALRAVLAELRGDPAGYAAARAQALSAWSENPEVDHLIGRKLSQKYRFEEGAARQRQALLWDPGHTGAKGQLAQDLLRLGQDEEGWALAEQAQAADPYDVIAWNLVTLRETISKFKTLESPHFRVRMDPKEAAVYGQRVLDLLERAYAHLGPKYGWEPPERTTVEIFPDPKDFAIRTFGLPGGAGFLGVCFGKVITANSPASRQSSPSNWESVLWHEFAHVITLQLTRNRMPRWLSEGISVYEERQARGSWGERMRPRYRAMILGDDLTPLSELSGAFLRPKTPVHLMFAYYESSLAVEYLLQRFGLETMKRVFADLASGQELNSALARHAAPLEVLDREFAERARALANGTGPGLKWEQPKPAEVATEEAYKEWVAANPENYHALAEAARGLIAERRWEEAKAPLRKLIASWPDQHEADSAYAQLALVHRELGERTEETAMLREVAARSGDAADALGRLTLVLAEKGVWGEALDAAQLSLSINPLVPDPHRQAARAWSALGDPVAAIGAWRTLLALNPPDLPEVHFQLATLLHDRGDREAKRYLLLALEETPRHRQALELLLRMQSVP